MEKSSVRLLSVLFVLLCWSFVCLAQQEKEKKSLVQLNGSIGFFYDYYHFHEENYASFRPRYPENLLRLNAQLNLKFGKHFSIPLSVNVTNQEVLYNLPSVPDQSALEYLQNPANNISINPKYKWAQAFIGTQTPQYSVLTTGDIPVFGAGLEINPGKFILSASYGKSQRAIEPNISLNIPGAYEQNIVAARIGVGKIEGSKFTINVVKIEDDITSVNTAPIGIDPIEGFTLSPYAEFKIFKKLKISTETAGSIYTSDLLNTGVLDAEFINDLGDYITINASSTADFAHHSRIDWQGEKFQIGSEIKYVGPGFLPVGYRFIERDILDYKINTGLNLFDKKVNFTGSFGVRTNNLNNTKLSSSKRVISNANLFTQVTEGFSINLNYSNFGFNNDASILNQRIELVNNSIAISPVYTWKSEKYNHLIATNITSSSFEQFDVVSNAFAKAENSTYSCNYNLAFLKTPLQLSAQVIYLENQIPTGDFNMLNYGITSSYKLLYKRLSPSLGVNMAQIDMPGFTTDYRTSLHAKISYKWTKKLTLKLQCRYSNFQYGSSRPNASLDQNRVQFSVQQRF